MKKRNVMIAVVILAVAVISLGAGFVIAETTIEEKIYAAYSLKNGTMRYLTDPTSYNPKLEAPISWNVQGVQGVPGAGFDHLAFDTNNEKGWLSPIYCIGPNGSQIWVSELYSVDENHNIIPESSGLHRIPKVTVDITSGKALVILTKRSIPDIKMSFTITGSTIRDGNFDQYVVTDSSMMFVVTDLINGPNTFTLAYTMEIFDVDLNWGLSIEDQSIMVIPLP